MHYDNLVRNVPNSQPEDWRDIGHPVWPQYLSYGTVRRDGELSDWISVREHSHGWVLRSNVQIQLAYGLKSGDELSFDWPALPNSEVIGRHVEIKFNGQPVFRAMLISVDDHRCVLPLPASETINDEQGMPSILYAYSATKDDCDCPAGGQPDRRRPLRRVHASPWDSRG
jgi:hypothetical protein